MKQEEDSIKACASYGYKRGYAQGVATVKELSALFDNPDVAKAADFIIEQLEAMAEGAHEHFHASLRVIDIPLDDNGMMH